MKKVFFLLAVIVMSNTLAAQPPQLMSYQAVLRDNTNQLLVMQAVGIKITILQGSDNGTPIYTETHSISTNENGLISIQIGSGTTTDNLGSINWGNGPYFIKTECDPTGGNNYTITSISQLLSVPYAFHANSATSLTGVYTETQALSISNDTIYLTNGGFVKIPEQKSIPALITYDDFSCTALRSQWTLNKSSSATLGFGWNNMDAISLNTVTGGNYIKIYSNKQKSVTEGKLIFTTCTYTYQDNGTAYGPLVRGLVNGMDRSNAIEFINTSGSVIQARTVLGNAATTTDYNVGNVADLHTYTIIATNKKVEFYVNGTLIATHTTNIPTAALNMYFDASTWAGNVPQCIDDAKFEIIKY